MITSSLGFPRIGAHRELKFAVEKFWSGEWTEEQLQSAAGALRAANWKLQADAGIDHIPSNDFSFYDHVLDTAVMLGAIPSRFGTAAPRSLTSYFGMARGLRNAAAMEMTKWFDTNYHYIVPEIEPEMEFHLAADKPVREFLEAKAQGILTRPVLLGPLSFAKLSRIRGRLTRADVVGRIVPVYQEVLAELAAAGARWVQMDEPCLSLDLDPAERLLLSRTYQRLAETAAPEILLASYFAPLRENLPLVLTLPVAALHLDLVRGGADLRPALEYLPEEMTLSLGVVDGRNIWRTDLDRALDQVRLAVDCLGAERVQIAPSCSLLHVPVDLDDERDLDPALRGGMAFARQKLIEIAFLAQAATNRTREITAILDANRAALGRVRSLPRACQPVVRARVATPGMLRRRSAFDERRARQSAAMPLPILPTTTIGSLPQTAEIRRLRAAVRRGDVTAGEYETVLHEEIRKAIRFQEHVGLDVLVHGEFERNDMVEYFAEQLDGFAFTRNGWVQSYGSRCVKPPILFGDVARRKAMTVELSRFAQSLTAAPVKGMLTGPVTMLQWSFVRDDLPREEVCRQIAFALRDEVRDLQVAGIRVIQVDEPALREGLPLRRSDRGEYLRWAVAAFRLATAVADDSTQIHTHMCYSEFGEILAAIREMDADVISIEAARSSMQLTGEIAPGGYANDIGPGVCDVHSPRVPDPGEFEDMIRSALRVFRPEQLWINPDCGLKTRSWPQVMPMLANMVAAVQKIRRDMQDPMALTGISAGGVRPNVTCDCN